jgi:pantothenate kinase
MVGIDALGFTTGGGLGLETASLVTTGQTLGTNWAQNYEKTTVDAKNAEVYGKYEKKYQADQKKKAGS